MAHIANPDDVEKFAERAFAASALGGTLDTLREMAKPHGLGVDTFHDAAAADMRVPGDSSGTEPTTRFRIHPFDEPDSGETFDTVEEVRAYLEALKPGDD